MKSGSHSLIVPENPVRLLPPGKTGDGAIEALGTNQSGDCYSGRQDVMRRVSDMYVRGDRGKRSHGVTGRPATGDIPYFSRNRPQFLKRAGALGVLLTAGGVVLDRARQKPGHLITPFHFRGTTADQNIRPLELVSIAPKQSVSSARTYASYAQSMEHWIAAVRRENPGIPRLVVYPEDVGLITALTGIRGEIARHVESLNWAMGSLILAYFPQILYYKRKFPHVPMPPNDLRLLWMALTDTMARSFLGAFKPIARQYQAYVVACLPIAPYASVKDISRRLLLGDWQRAPNSVVFEAQTPEIYNTAFIFDPEGQIVDRVHKVHLVEAERSLLNLAAGNIKDVHAISLNGIGRVGIAISKDAWMPDVLDRLAQDNAEILIQPDANDGFWATSPVLTNWQPDGWKQGNWVDVQKYASFQYNINPMMTGNLFNVPFDGQSSIVAKVRSEESLKGYIGQEPDGGFQAMAPWVMTEPSSMPLCQRRKAFVKRSQLLAPGSGSPIENHYQATVLSLKTSLQPNPSGSVFVPSLSLKSVTIAQAEQQSQWLPALASDKGGSVYIAFVASSHGTGTVFVARSSDNGQSYAPPRAVDRVNAAQWGPAIDVDDHGNVYVAWSDYRSQNWEVRLAISRNQGNDFEPSQLVAPKTARPLATGIKLRAVAPDEVYVLWSDDRLANAVTDVYLVKSADQGRSFTKPVRVSDTPTFQVEGTTYGMGYAWNPCMASLGQGSLAVCWQDFRPQNLRDRSTRRNTVRMALSNDSGEHFAPSAALSLDREVEQYLPHLLISDSTTLTWTWIERQRSGSTELVVAESQRDLTEWHNIPLPKNLTRGALAVNVARTSKGVIFVAWVSSSGDLMMAHNLRGQFSVRRVESVNSHKAQAPVLAIVQEETVILGWQEQSQQSTYIRTAVLSPF